MKQYENVVRQLKAKIRESRTLLEEKKSTPAIQVFRHRELAQEIAKDVLRWDGHLPQGNQLAILVLLFGADPNVAACVV